MQNSESVYTVLVAASAWTTFSHYMYMMATVLQLSENTLFNAYTKTWSWIAPDGFESGMAVSAKQRAHCHADAIGERTRRLSKLSG